MHGINHNAKHPLSHKDSSVKILILIPYLLVSLSESWKLKAWFVLETQILMFIPKL